MCSNISENEIFFDTAIRDRSWTRILVAEVTKYRNGPDGRLPGINLPTLGRRTVGALGYSAACAASLVEAVARPAIGASMLAVAVFTLVFAHDYIPKDVDTGGWLISTMPDQFDATLRSSVGFVKNIFCDRISFSELSLCG